MRLARADMRDHIVSYKNDHGASYAALRSIAMASWLKINFCEIFGVVQFSTFATISGTGTDSWPDDQNDAIHP